MQGCKDQESIHSSTTPDPLIFIIIIEFDNPYNYSVLFVGQRQRVQTKIRHHRTRYMISV